MSFSVFKPKWSLGTPSALWASRVHSICSPWWSTTTLCKAAHQWKYPSSFQERRAASVGSKEVTWNTTLPSTVSLAKALAASKNFSTISGSWKQTLQDSSTAGAVRSSIFKRCQVKALQRPAGCQVPIGCRHGPPPPVLWLSIKVHLKFGDATASSKIEASGRKSKHCTNTSPAEMGHAWLVVQWETLMSAKKRNLASLISWKQ